MALDAIYGYATDPENWEEMTTLLAHLDSAAGDENMHELIEGLRTHLGRAESLAQRLHEGPATDEPAPSYCHMIVGRDMRIAEISDAAIALLRPFCGPLEAGRMLSFTDPENAARFRTLAAAIDKGGEGPSLLRLVSDEGDEAIFGYLLAEPGLPEALRRRLGLSGQARKGALAFVAPDRDAEGDPSRVYRETFGLTPAEARLAARLKDGLSLKEAAADLGISVNTARNQIRAVFEKLGVNRQSDLIRHLTELSQLAAYIQIDAGSSFEPLETASLPHGTPRRFFDLPDGRRLCYREYGVAGGVPVVMFRSSLNSSLVRAAEAEAALEIGLRLIAVERPGTGLSTIDPDLSFQSFACDVETLLAALHVGDFYLLANASSAWFGIAVAARLGARVRRLMLTSPRLSPPRPQKGRPGMANYFFSNLRRHPWLLDSTLFILRAKLSRPFMRSLVFHFFEKSPVDFAMLERNPVLVEDMLDSTIESVGAGYRGLMQEGQLIIEGNFPDISAVVSPVVVWYGEQDGIMSPAEILDGLARHGLVTEELTGFPDVGHYLYENRQRELLERLIR